MSNYLPVEIQTEIMKRLPVKTLLQFRTVSKAWKSIIDSSEFINNYQGQVQHLLLTYTDDGHRQYQFQKHVSYVDDDDTFPHEKCFPFVPKQIKMLRCFEIIGCSSGLLCFTGDGLHPDKDYDISKQFNEVAVLWNISIEKAVAVVLPEYTRGYRDFIGFGVCGVTNEVKIVNIKLIDSECKDTEDIISCASWRVEVFSLSTGVWRSVDNNFPRKSIELCLYRNIVVLDETMYWLAMEKVVVIGREDRSYNMIVSFDITKEEFKEVKLPDNLAQQPTYENLYISKLRKSLAVIEENGVEGNPSFNVWKMEGGIYESFTKLYTICIPDAEIYSVLEFRKNGEPILEVPQREERLDLDETSLVGYDPVTKRIKYIIEKAETEKNVDVSSYMETLHLCDQPDSIIYDKGKRFGLKKIWKKNLEA